MKEVERMISSYHMGFIVCLCLAVFLLILTVIMFFKFKIKYIVQSKSGRETQIRKKQKSGVVVGTFAPHVKTEKRENAERRDKTEELSKPPEETELSSNCCEETELLSNYLEETELLSNCREETELLSNYREETEFLDYPEREDRLIFIIQKSVMIVNSDEIL